MCEEVTKQVYQTLLARSRNGRLRKHDTREVADQFGDMPRNFRIG